MITYKRAQIGSTITWFIGFIIIFFILIIFIGFAAQIAQKQGFFKKSENLEISKSHSMEDIRKFINFLNSPVDKTNSEFLVKDLLLSGADETNENLEKFNNLAKEFMKEYIIMDKKYENAWIRIYDSSDKVSKDYTGKYDKYSIEESVVSKLNIFTSKICNPLPGEYAEYFVLFRKVVICMN